MDKIKKWIKDKFRKKQKNSDSVAINEIENIDVSKVEFKRKKHFFPSLVIASNTKVKNVLTFIIPVALIATGVTLGVTLNSKNDDDIKKEVILETNKIYHRVYLLSSDDYVVPLSFKMNQRLTIQEEIIEVFSLLKTNTKAGNDYLRGYIPVDTKLLNIELNEEILTLNMSNEFNNYTEKNEVKMLESLVHTFLDFDGVSQLKLQVDGKSLSTFPNNNLVFPTILNNDIGLNRLNYTEDVSSKTRTVVFYNHTYDSKQYMIPVSLYSEESEQVSAFISNTKYLPSISTGLKKISTYNSLDYEIAPLINEEGIFISVNDSCLMEEGIVSSDIYELILLSFSFMDIDQNVSLTIEGESYQVNGYYYNDDVEVSSITYNQFAI